ncbi:MAG: ABC transporter permease [Dehalococcoidia bacterium]|nr:ABC transporter permease [Dehalococcoidia bacterium]MDW8119763.1 ABC transporter permease [Chloroflexota bacterium]
MRSTAEMTRPLEWRARIGFWKGVGRFFRTKPLGAAGAVVILLMGVTALFADLIAPYDPYQTNYAHQLAPPGGQFLLGTDQMGRDLLSRLIHGSRVALLVGFSAAFIGSTIGALLGVVSAYFGKTFDLVVQRFIDILSAFPLLILAIAVVAMLGRSTPNLIIAIAIPIVPLAARVVRSTALAIKEFQYIEAARALGATSARIILRHMLPNTMAPYLIILTAHLGQAILVEASLSFLGIGTAEPTPSWGLMMSGAATRFVERAPWMVIFPGLAISLAVFAFNLLGDSLRDVLDPRLRRGV